MRKEVLVLIVFLIMFASLTFASVNYNGGNIKTSYYGGEIITGRINLSFSNEPAGNLLTSNFNGSIGILDLVRNNSLISGTDYSCDTMGCNKDYLDSGIISQISLGQNDKKIFGFKITDNNIEVTDLNFSLTSDSPASCGQQIKLTFIGNGMAMQNYRYKTTPCSEVIRGCFNNNLGQNDYDSPAILSSSPICEKIHLPIAAAYYLGANITNTSSGYSSIRMQIVSNESWEPLAQCTLPSMNSANQALGCIVNYSSMIESDFYVCISADSPSDYRIRTEKSGDICGTPSGSYNPQKDYDLFAQALPFDNIALAVNRETFSKFNSNDLIQEIYSYLSEKYNGNCTNGCFVPFEVSGLSQNINLGTVSLKYKSYNQPYILNKIYLLNSSSPKITMNVRNLEIGYANFTIPLTTNENSLKLYVNGNKIITFGLNITSGFSFDISPKLILPGMDTNFSILGVSENVSSNWDFGDNTSAQNGVKSIIHRYSNSGSYKITVQVNNPSGGSSRASFDVIVGNPQEAARQLIGTGEARIGNVSQQIESYPAWIVQYLKDKLNMSDLQAQLLKIKNDYGVSTNDEQYSQQVSKLQNLQIPYLVSDSVSGTLPLLASQDKIDSSYLLSLSGASGQDSANVKKAITSWESTNYQADVSFRKVKAYGDGRVIDLATIVKVKLKPLVEQKDNIYFIINYPISAIKFASSYGEKVVDSGSYIGLSGKDEEIEFSVPGDVELTDLGMYLSPEVSRLSVGETIAPAEIPAFKTGWFIVLIGALLVITLIIYILLQEWYKRNYELSLFRNKDDLYNMINFIYNSRASGMDDSEARKKLSKSGWTGEQLSYAFNKIDGKRTGMYEIPLLKFRENNNVREEIARRQNGAVDARFIKRPNQQ